MATGSLAGVLSLAQAAAENASTPQPSHFAALRPRLERFIVCLLGIKDRSIGPRSPEVQAKGQAMLDARSPQYSAKLRPNDPMPGRPRGRPGMLSSAPGRSARLSLLR